MYSAQRSLRVRMLSALLLLVLLGGMLPFAALPTLASPGMAATVDYIPADRLPDEHGNYETSLADNLWRGTFSKNPLEGTITYYGGWTAGCVMDGHGYRPFTYMNSSDGTWFTLDTTDQWASTSGTIGRNSLDIRPHHSEGTSTGVGYRAEYTGIVNFSVDAISSAGEDGFAIFSGGRMIWPTPGASVGAIDDLTNWYVVNSATTAAKLNEALASFSYSCLAEEDIAFVFKRGSGTGYCRVEPRVTYVTTSFSGGKRTSVAFRNENFPTYGMKDGHLDLLTNFGDGWCYGSFPRDNASEYTLFNNMSDAYKILNRGKGGNDDDQWTYGGLYLETGVVITANNYVSFFGYRAEFGGDLNISVDSITAAKSSSDQDIMFCIALNGEMLWPKKGGTIDDPDNYGDWYTLTAAGANAATDTRMNASALTGVEVNVGDLVQYCFVARTSHSMTTRDVALTVTYSSVRSTIPAAEEAGSTLAENYPTLSLDREGNGSVLTYNGRWSYMAAPRGTKSFTPLTKLTGGQLLAGKTQAQGYVQPRYNNKDYARLAPGSEYDVAIAYTARYAGKATLALDADDFGSGAKWNFAVYQNGEEVAGSDRVGAAELNGKKVELTLRASDTIYIALSSVAAAAATDAAVALTPTLTYGELTDRVALTGMSMGIAKDLTLYFYMGADGLFSDMEEYGILIWKDGKPRDFDNEEKRAIRLTEGQTQSDFRMRIAYTGIAAKQMADTLWVRPYVKEDGNTHYGDPVSFSVVEYAKQLYGRTPELDTLLTDMLLYGAAAQEFFGYRTDNLATATLTEEQLGYASSVAYLYVDQKSIGQENTRNPAASRIEAFSLSLDNRITYCAHIARDESEAENPIVLEVSVNYNMADHTDFTVDENGHVKALSINAAEVGRVYYFRLRTVREGMTCYGPIISYNIESYAAGLAADNRTDMAKLSAALMNYGYSALTYATVA